MSKITIENIYADDVFEWFYNSVMSNGGDGAAFLVCNNYKEASDLFVEWYKLIYDKDEFFHIKTILDDKIYYHDNNENFVFTSIIPNHMYDKDYLFIIKEDCPFGWRFKGKVLLAI